jgi:hypothetical protein
MNKEQLIKDLKEMVKADTGHLAAALERGERVRAHRFVDAIIDNCREIQDARKD